MVRVSIGFSAGVKASLRPESVWWPLSEVGHGHGWNQSESVSGSVCGQSEVTLM